MGAGATRIFKSAESPHLHTGRGTGYQDTMELVQSGTQISGTISMWKDVDGSYANGAQLKTTTISGAINGRDFTASWQFPGGDLHTVSGTVSEDSQSLTGSAPDVGTRNWTRVD